MTCAVVMATTIIFSPTSAHAATTSVVIPMTIRHANSTETAGMETLIDQTIYPQFGPNINHNFSETSKDIHTGRSWVIEAKPSLPSCATNVVFSIEGDYKFTHNANNGPLVKPGDEPEVGGLIVDGGDTTTLGGGIVASEADMAVGATLNVTTAPASVSVAHANSGIKVVMYVETRDDRDHNGVQASFTYSGTPQLRLSYDNGGCNAATTATTAPKKKTPTKSNSTAGTSVTTVPTEVLGNVAETSVYESGKISVAAKKGTHFSTSNPVKNDVRPAVIKSSGNTTLNAITFGTMVAALAIGLTVFIVKQRNHRKTPFRARRL